MRNRELLVPQPLTKALAPVNLLNLTMCQCKMSASITAPAATQDLLAQKGASAWQMMKDVGTLMV